MSSPIAQLVEQMTVNHWVASMIATARKPKSRILPLVHDDRSSEEARGSEWKEDQTCWVKIQLADREFTESSDRFYDALQKLSTH